MSTEDDDLARAHRAVKELAKALEIDGVDPENILDALLVVGVNASERLYGPVPAVAFLRKSATAIELGASMPSSTARH